MGSRVGLFPQLLDIQAVHFIAASKYVHSGLPKFLMVAIVTSMASTLATKKLTPRYSKNYYVYLSWLSHQKT